jgi:hypothetical protein
MGRRGQATKLRVQSQGRAYVAVIGVTVGMLFAGLAVPLAFGRVPDRLSSSDSNDVRLDSGFAGGESPQPGATSGPGTGPGGQPVPGAQPSSGGSLAGAGTTGGSLPSAGPTGPGGAPSGVTLRATDQGVTAKSVKLGVVLLDIEKLKPLGFAQPRFTPQEQRQQFQVFIDRVNKAGGLLGRRITPVFVIFDALDSRGERSGAAVCSQLAEDHKVFAAVGFLDGNIGECLTAQWGIPAIANVGHIAESYTKGHNLLVSPFATLERGAANWGDLASRSGLLRGRTIGTVFSDIPQENRPEAALVSALKAKGHAVAYRAKFGSDPATAQSQLPIEVRKMQQAGVDTVFLVISFVGALQFASTAEQQDYKPLYVVSDLGSLTVEGLVSNMPSSFDGAYGFTQSNPASPEPAADKRCRDYFNTTTGNSYKAGKDAGPVRLICWMLLVFEAGAERVGPELTRRGLGTAFQQLGTLPLPHSLGGSFRPGKTDYGDYFRPLRYASSCKCYSSVGAKQRGAY